MTPRQKFGLRYLVLLFFAFFAMYGVVLSLGILFVMPMLRWVLRGVLQFPVSGPELVALCWLVLGLSAITTALIWLEGKIHKRW